jgi:hypothetical protein
MTKKAKEILISIDEMAGLNQRIYVDSNCTGLVQSILAITKNTKVYDISHLTGKTNSLDKEIHNALQDIDIKLLVFVTKNSKHFDIRKLRSASKYYLICILGEEIFNDIIAKHIVDACRYDPELKVIRGQDDTYPVIYIDHKYIRKLKRLKK